VKPVDHADSLLPSRRKTDKWKLRSKDLIGSPRRA
jgi:hypothetical protein